MKNSIRDKLFLGIGAITLCFVCLSLLLNSQLLEKYYIFEKKHVLKTYGDNIDKIFKGDPDLIGEKLQDLESTSGVHIFILNKEFDTRYSSFGRIFNQRQGLMLLPKRGIGLPLPVVEELLRGLDDQKYVFKILKEENNQMGFLFLTQRMQNEDILILRVPLTSLSENASIANKFMFFSGLVSLLLGFILAYLFANKFTKPILKLNRVAENMAKLDFSQKYHVESDDEIGQLGQKINYLSEQLDQAITELNEKNKFLTLEIEKERAIEEMRKEFISSVSHELKTPISLIQGYAEGLKFNIASDEESKAYYCEVILDEAFKMNKLVKDLLNLSQLESGFFQLEKITFNLGDLVNQVLQKFQGFFAENKVEPLLKNTIKSLAYGDKERIEQVLTNYLSNALNHLNEEKQLEISLEEEAEHLRVAVFNSGKKVPLEDLDKIWLSFYKVDKARTREYGGYGVGLAVVRAIQEQHGCSFGVENKAKGVEFWFDIAKSKTQKEV